MKVDIYTDGGARGNPGPAAYGFVIYKDGEKHITNCEYIGESTNNIAEYTGVLKALQFASQLSNCHEVNVFLDSQLVQKQMTGEYKIKNEGLRELANTVKELEGGFKKVTYTHILREKNKEADRLVNKALDQHFSAESS